MQTQSPPFLLEIGADDPFGIEQGSVDPETISSGFWMMLPPLSRGEHELTVRGGLCSSEEIPEPDPDTAPFVLRPFFAVDVTYRLFVGM